MIAILFFIAVAGVVYGIYRKVSNKVPSQPREGPKGTHDDPSDR